MQLADSFCRRHCIAPLRFAGYVQMLKSAGLAQLFRQPLTVFHQYVPDDDLGTLCQEGSRLRFAKATRSAGKEEDSVSESGHGGFLGDMDV